MKYTAKAILTILFFAWVVWSCEDSAPFSIDPVVTNSPFTFEPLHGYAGNSVKIKGAGLSDVEKISFGIAEGVILQKSNEEITATVPVGAITSKIKLVRSNSVITSKDDFTVDATPIPTLMEFLPAIAGSGDLIAITGNQLDMVDSVYIGNLKAEIQSGRSETAMEILAPAGLQTGKIRMFYQYMTSYGFPKVGESAGSTNLSLKLPVISSIEPDISLLNIGDELTMTGSMMNEVTRVQFGAIDAATFAATDDATLKVTVPAGATTGKIILSVPDGTMQSSTDFQVNLPAITSFFPGKGAEISGGTRTISLQGTKLDLVQSINVGNTVAVINNQSETLILFTISGATSGTITLNTANGPVKSTVPFIITGNFWLTDYDQTFVPQRMTHEGWDGGAGYTSSIAASGEVRGNYRRTTANCTDGGSPRYYFRGDGTGANPAPDRFLLYSNDSKDVYLEFDISYNALPASLIDANGDVSLKIFLFAADQARGYGYSSLVKVKFGGANIWKPVRVNTNNMGKETGSSGLFTADIPPLSNRFEPNNCRIIGVMFAGAIGNAEAVGQTIDVNFDNVKFVIE